MYEHIVAVTNRHLCEGSVTKQVEKICQLHPKAVLLREKDLTEEEYEALAKEILAICRRYEVPCVLHYYPDVARRLKEHAIHLPLWKLRQMQEQEKSEFKMIGSSVHSVEEAMEAQSLGAAYITAGHIYTTDCKKGLPARGLDFLREVCQAVTIPVYAIGGIEPNERQIREVKECGAMGACVMSGMMRV